MVKICDNKQLYKKRRRLVLIQMIMFFALAVKSSLI